MEKVIGELLAEVKRLQEENKELQRLVQVLREQLATATQQLEELARQLSIAEERVAEPARSQKKAPSFVKANKPKSTEPKEPRRRRAAEHNHGRKRAEAVTYRQEHRIEQCPQCECKLRKVQEAWRRQVTDIPLPRPVEVTEHVCFKGYCPRCGVWHYGEAYAAGETMGQSRFGARLIAKIGLLSETLRLPYGKIKSYLKMEYGLEISEGAIADIRRRLAQRLEPVRERAKAQIRSSGIVHADETGWRENGQNGYVWVFSTPAGQSGICYYHYEKSRAHQVVEKFLGEAFQGVLVSDFYGAYNVYPGLHQRCWVHLLRDLHFLKEDHPEDETVQRWARELRALYDSGVSFVKTEPQSQEEREQLYLTLWNEVGRLGLPYAREKHPCRALSKRVLRHQDELFQFVRVAGLAADNNLAERSLRPLVVTRKISGGTRSAQGSETRMTLASIFATFKIRGLDPFQECLALIQANS